MVLADGLKRVFGSVLVCGGVFLGMKRKSIKRGAVPCAAFIHAVRRLGIYAFLFSSFFFVLFAPFSVHLPPLFGAYLSGLR